MVEQELRDVEKALAPSKIYYLDGTMSKIDYAGIGLAQNFQYAQKIVDSEVAQTPV